MVLDDFQLTFSTAFQQIYFNDIWRSNIKENSPTVWERVPVPGQRDPHKFDMPWEPRTGLAVALEEGASLTLSAWGV